MAKYTIAIILILFLSGCASARFISSHWDKDRQRWIPDRKIEVQGQGKVKVGKDIWEAEGKPTLRMPEFPSMPLKVSAQ